MELNTILAYAVGGPIMASMLTIAIGVPIMAIRRSTSNK